MLKNLFHSSILNSWFSAIAGLVSSIIAIPIVITTLSVEEINVWFLFAAIVALSQGVQFGFNATFTRFISYVYGGVKIEEFRGLRFKNNIKYESKLDKEEFSRVFYLMKNVYFILSLVYFIVLFLVGYFSLLKPIEALANQTDGWIAASIVLFSSTVTLSFGYYQNFMLGINKVALVQRITGIVNILGLAFILGVLFIYPTLVSIIFIYQLVLLTVLASVIFFAKKEFRQMNIEKKSGFDKELFSIVWESAWKSGITTIIANVVKHMSAIIVAQFFVPSVSASFLFTKRIFDIIESFTMVTFQARIPMIARYRGQGNFKVLIPYLKQTQYISYGVYLLGYVVLLATGDYLLTFISSNVNLGSYGLIILFSFTSFMSRWGGMTLSISNQSNHVVEHINAIVYFLTYFISLYLLFHFDSTVEDFIFAQLIAICVSISVVINIVYKNLRTTFWNYEKYLFIPMFGMLTLINFIYYWNNT